VRRFIGVPLKLERVSSDAFDSMLRIAYEAGSGAAMQMLEGLDDNTDLAHLARISPSPRICFEKRRTKRPSSGDQCIAHAGREGKRVDIHIEPYENRLVIRSAVDGVLREVLQTKRAVAPLVVSRIKSCRSSISRSGGCRRTQNLLAHRRPCRRCARFHPTVGPRRARGAAIARQASRAHRTTSLGMDPRTQVDDG